MEQVFVNQKPDWDFESATALFAITGEPSSVQSSQGEGDWFLIKILFTQDDRRIPINFKANESKLRFSLLRMKGPSALAVG